MAKTRDDLLKLAKRQYDEVDGFRLRSLTELEVTELESRWGKRYRDTKEIDLVMRRELIVQCMVDDEGNRILRDDDVEVLGELPAPVVSRIYRRCRDLCGMNEAVDEVKEAEKNSDETLG